MTFNTTRIYSIVKKGKFERSIVQNRTHLINSSFFLHNLHVRFTLSFRIIPIRNRFFYFVTYLGWCCIANRVIFSFLTYRATVASELPRSVRRYTHVILNKCIRY
uniref:Uncharacterized protein n=1 Tax=Sipha flava TaxID=143950 RepID=A0A2S2Q1A2_9HEMI